MKKIVLALVLAAFSVPSLATSAFAAGEKDAKAVNACLFIDTKTGKCRQWIVLDAGGGSE